MIKYCLFVLAALFAQAIGGYAESDATRKSDLAQTREIFIDSVGCKIFCRTMGKGDPLIVIHGGPGLGQDYLLPQLYKLAANNLVIFYDQRGCGKSTGEIHEDTMTIPALVKDLENLRKAFNFNKISLLGHSWGGLLAMHYALEHPQCVDKLILSNSLPASSEEVALFGAEWVRRTSTHQEEISAIQKMESFQEGNPELHERLNRLILKTYCHIAEDADNLDLHMSQTAAINCTKINQIFWTNTLGKPFNLHEALKILRIPTLIIHGDDDPIPLSTAQHIHESIQGSKYMVLKDCGHFPYVEQPEAYFKSLNEFLE